MGETMNLELVFNERGPDKEYLESPFKTGQVGIRISKRNTETDISN
jgi:hypothetical protein